MTASILDLRYELILVEYRILYQNETNLDHVN